MFTDLTNILSTLNKMLIEMVKSNKNMEKLTTQLEILTMPPDMIKWAISRKKLYMI